MLRHYVENILPNGLKAQVVAISRRAAVRYPAALAAARDELVTEAGPSTLRCEASTTWTRFMEKFAGEKRFWIYTKLAEKETLAPAAPTKKYVSGEGFASLGRNYGCCWWISWTCR